MAAGNLAVSSGILFSGNTFQRIKELLNIAKIPVFSHVTFNKVQNIHLFPAIHRVFQTNRTLLLEMLKEQKQINLLGDGRCDSPGYCAKYGTYTIMDSTSGYIIDCHVSHSKMAGNSQQMELDGFKNVLRRLEEAKIFIKSLTTDRHKQIRAFFRKCKQYITHQFDVWHVGRNIKKRLIKFAKKKCNQELNAWIKAIINHFWWSCASCHGNAKELEEKWTSILNHITDKHHWRGNTIYKKCQHKKL